MPTKTETWTFDLGNNCGWACRLDDTGLIHSGVERFNPGGRDEGIGRRYLRFRAFILKRFDIALSRGYLVREVRYEAVQFLVEGAGANAPHQWGGFEAILTAWCEGRRIRYRGIAPATLKKAATGNHKASKDDVTRAVKMKFGIDPIIDDNHGDSLALLCCDKP